MGMGGVADLQWVMAGDKNVRLDEQKNFCERRTRSNGYRKEEEFCCTKVKAELLEMIFN